jgi:amino acid transporter
MAELRRVLGVWSAAAIVIGTVIGSGIFLVPQEMIRQVGSPAMLFAVWVFGGLLTLGGALTYAEMAAALPEAGGEYVYLREAYGPFWGYIYGWTQMWVAKSGSIATLATAFVYYLANFLPRIDSVVCVIALPIGPGGGPLEIRYNQLLAMAIIMALALVNYYGVKLGGGVQVAVTVVKVGLIAVIIVIGLGSGTGSASNYHSTAAATGGMAGFFAALVAALWAYDGWNNVSMLGSEIRRPERNLPLALVWGILAVVLIYLAANAAYFYVLSSNQVAASPRVAAEMMRRIGGSAGASAVSVAAMISIFAALNGSILAGSRVPYAMARDGVFFKAIAHVHPEHHTPSVSILALSGWAALLVLSGHYKELFTYVIFASWILYGMTTAAVIVLRRKRPELARPYRTLGYPVVPVLFVAAAALLIYYTLRTSPRESVMGLSVIALGLPFYLYWKRRRA